MKKIKTFILCGLILVSGMFSKHVFAGGIDDIKNEFITQCRNFKYDDQIVEDTDKKICDENHVDKIGKAPWKEVLERYSDLFRYNSGNCRVASAYFSTRFDSANVENRELNVIFEVGNMHSVNLYKIGEEWYVADFIMAIKNPECASDFFAVKLEDFVLGCVNGDTGERALAYGVYNKTDRGGVDLGEFIPTIKVLLDGNDFYLYVGPNTFEPIRVKPRISSNLFGFLWGLL